jgi:aldose 1-epimerase
MADFRISSGRRGTEPVVVVSAPDDTTRLVIAHRGATLLSWQVNRDGAPAELTDGYRDDVELLGQDGVRNGVLAPFGNRIAAARYHFDGHDYDLRADQEPDGVVLHGFARRAVFQLTETTTHADGARLRLRTAQIRPGRHPGYPFAIDLQVTVLIGATTIEMEIEATNVGDRPAPYTAGWHPYFRLADTIDELTLQIPAETLIRTDTALIPLNGDQARLPLDHCPSMDFRRIRQVGATVIDACFGDLNFQPSGRAETVLRNPETGSELRVWQNTGFMHVFTGDTLARDRRRSIALEPVEAITDAFNRSASAPAIRLDPGRQRRFRFGVAYTPFCRSG